MACAHYQFSPRWKFSSFLAYYRNKDVPDIGQYEAPEWRWALQGRYYFHKTGFILNTDMRFELRFIADENGTFNDIYRYRQKFKYLQPLNSKMLRKGVVFVYASEEIWLSRRLKAWGRRRGLSFIVITTPRLRTSSRKDHWYPAPLLGLTGILFALFPFLVLSRRFCWLWYRRPTVASTDPAPPS